MHVSLSPAFRIARRVASIFAPCPKAVPVTKNFGEVGEEEGLDNCLEHLEARRAQLLRRDQESQQWLGTGVTINELLHDQHKNIIWKRENRQGSVLLAWHTTCAATGVFSLGLSKKTYFSDSLFETW